MTNLCKMFYPQDLDAEMQKLSQKPEVTHGPVDPGAGT
jgi:hypothetical protein